jgi:hypothetical protein
MIELGYVQIDNLFNDTVTIRKLFNVDDDDDDLENGET